MWFGCSEKPNDQIAKLFANEYLVGRQTANNYRLTSKIS